MRIVEVLSIRTQNKPGTFNQFTELVARFRGQLQDIETQLLGKRFNVRNVIVELEEVDLEPFHVAVKDLVGVTLLSRTDRVFALHEGGKLESRSRLRIDKIPMLRCIYTPGVARVCLAIKAAPALAAKYTSINRTVAVVTNGTRVLSLGNRSSLLPMYDDIVVI